MSSSKKNVIRGLHIQTKKPQAKVITVVSGKIMDVAVDLRKNSKTFGKHFKIILSEKNSKSLLIPSGFAHGFLTLSTQATVVYNVSSVYEPKSDTGIRYDSFGFKMPISKPIVSDRDNSFESFKNFNSPF